MADIKESQLTDSGNISKVRTLDPEGNSTLSSVDQFTDKMRNATVDKSGLMSVWEVKKRLFFNSPVTSDLAVKIASFQPLNGYYGDSIQIQYSAFSLCAILFLVCNVVSGTPTFALKVVTQHGTNGAKAKVIITKDEDIYNVYLTGSYPSGYTPSTCIARCGDSFFQLHEDNTTYPISELNILHEFIIG